MTACPDETPDCTEEVALKDTDKAQYGQVVIWYNVRGDALVRIRDTWRKRGSKAPKLSDEEYGTLLPMEDEVQPAYLDLPDPNNKRKRVGSGSNLGKTTRGGARPQSRARSVVPKANYDFTNPLGGGVRRPEIRASG